MKTIAVLSNKGGSGKSTVAINLAVAATLDSKSAALIDLDPQASASLWGDNRESDSPSVIAAQASRLPKIMDAARKANADLVIIDTAPHSESAALTAAKIADLVLIPCRPAILDLRGIQTTFDLVSLSKATAKVIFNAVPPQKSLLFQAQKAIDQLGGDYLPIQIGQRIAYQHSLTVSQGVLEYDPSSKAAGEIKALYKAASGLV